MCSSAAVVEVGALVKRYGELLAVDGVEFEVEAGEVFGIIGPNGSGKTTTVECLQGLRAADAGVLRVLGLDPARQGSELRRRIGCQLQEAALPSEYGSGRRSTSSRPCRREPTTGAGSSVTGAWTRSGTRSSTISPAGSGSGCSSRSRS